MYQYGWYLQSGREGKELSAKEMDGEWGGRASLAAAKT